MVDHPDKTPAGSRPAFERLTAGRTQIVLEILDKKRISIPQALVKEYLGDIDPAVEVFSELIDDEMLAALEDEDQIKASSLLYDLGRYSEGDGTDDICLLNNEESLQSNAISSLRTKYLLDHVVRKVPIARLASGVKFRLAEIVAEVSGRGNHNLPEAWISSLTRGRIDELMKKGEHLRRDTAYSQMEEIQTHRRTRSFISSIFESYPEEFDEAEIEEVKAYAESLQPEWIEELHDSDTRIVDYVTANPDPGPLVDKLLNVEKLGILGQIATKKPLS